MVYCQHEGLAWILSSSLKMVQVKRNTTGCAKPEKVCENWTRKEPYWGTEMHRNFLRIPQQLFHVATGESAW